MLRLAACGYYPHRLYSLVEEVLGGRILVLGAQSEFGRRAGRMMLRPGGMKGAVGGEGLLDVVGVGGAIGCDVNVAAGRDLLRQKFSEGRVD